MPVWPRASSLPARLAAATLPALAAAVLAGCGTAVTAAAPAPGKLQVVAAENFWGSIAAQLGGTKVAVSSIIVNPDTDPHSYEPTASDAATLARSQMAIVNGIGYDRWASQLLSANSSSSRVTLNVGDVLGLKEGDNPHRWYSPMNVHRVIAQIVADYQRLDPKDGAYFEGQRAAFEARALGQYEQLIVTIRRRFGGVPVGYSESIFEPLGQALDLHLLTPYSFAKAIAEGTEVTAQDKQTVDGQARQREIKVWIYNSQNVTPDVQRVTEIVRAQHIPIATVTETLSPPSDGFEQWQVGELKGLIAALREATGR